MTPLPLWMVILAGIGVFAMGSAVGFWAGDTSQEVKTVLAKVEAERVKRESAERDAAIQQVTIEAQKTEIAKLEELRATSALLAADAARDEREARRGAQAMEDQVRAISDELAEARKARAPSCDCRLSPAFIRRLQSIRIGEPPPPGNEAPPPGPPAPNPPTIGGSP